MLKTRQNKIRNFGRSWLLNHPKINPYKWFHPGIFRTITAPFRVLPDYLIIGVQKGGTSSLYDYLIKHPNVYPTFEKESHFFDLSMGKRWYRSYFPTIFTKFYVKYILQQSFITGEATPNYIFFPYCAKKIFKVVPKAKLILILRNPVDRAYSQYQMKVKKEQENLSFEEGVKLEEKRLSKDQKITDEQYYNSKNFNRYAYLLRGIYSEQLKMWMDIFPREQFLILTSEEFDSNEDETLNKVFEFLNLKQHTPKNLQRKHVGNYKESMNPETRKKLIEYFRPHNEKLYKFLGRKFDWDK